MHSDSGPEDLRIEREKHINSAHWILLCQAYNSMKSGALDDMILLVQRVKDIDCELLPMSLVVPRSWIVVPWI